MQEDYGWFSPADFNLVVKALAKHPNRNKLVIIGGQALVAWVMAYGVAIPKISTPYLTQDLDIFGLCADAEVLAEALGADVYAPSLDDHTPSSAQIVLKSLDSGKTLLIDFLLSVLGLDDEEVHKLAVPLQFDDQPEVNVLHPLLCIRSRFENLYRLSNKRNANGVAQALVAVEVGKAFILEQLASGHERQATRAAIHMAHTAAKPSGVFAFTEYGIDLLNAVNTSVFQNAKFAGIEWPKRCAPVLRKRNVAQLKRTSKFDLEQRF